MKTAKIYTLKDPETNQIRYVGKTEKTLKERMYYHTWDIKRTKNNHKKNWFNSLSNKNLKPEIELIEEVPIEEWRFWEQFYISIFKSWGFNLINYTDGGEGYSSNQLKKLWKTKEYREYHTKRMIGKNNPFFGKKHTEKTKDILRKKCPKRGKENPMYGKKRTKEENEKMRLNQPNLKKYIRLDLEGGIIDEWIGLKYMCRELQLDEAAVLRVIKGKNNHHKGFKFNYG